MPKHILLIIKFGVSLIAFLLVMYSCNNEYTEFYENGQLKIKGSYVDEKKHGLWQSYYENGGLKEEQYYKKGKLDSVSKRWNEEGILVEISNFKEDVLDGTVVTYYQNGTLKDSIIYSRGEKSGFSYSWNENGKITAEKHFKEGILNGTCKVWFDNGNLKEKSNYVNDVLDGSVVTYFNNGSTKDSSLYSNGLKSGYVYKWYANTQLASKELYVDDSLDVSKSKYWKQYEKIPFSPQLFNSQNSYKLAQGYYSKTPLQAGKSLIKVIEKYTPDLVDSAPFEFLFSNRNEDSVLIQYGKGVNFGDITGNGYQDMREYFYGVSDLVMAIYLKDKTGVVGGVITYAKITNLEYNKDGKLTKLVTHSPGCCTYPIQYFDIITFSYSNEVKFKIESYQIVSNLTKGFIMPDSFSLNEKYNLIGNENRIYSSLPTQNPHSLMIKDVKEITILHKEEVKGEMWAFVKYERSPNKYRMGWIKLSSK